MLFFLLGVLFKAITQEILLFLFNKDVCLIFKFIKSCSLVHTVQILNEKFVFFIYTLLNKYFIFIFYYKRIFSFVVTKI